MTFALDSNPTPSEVSGAINYLLSNFGSNITVDLTTGQVLSSGGFVVSYLYRYIAIKYSDSIDGSTNFSDTPTNRGYYGVRNSCQKCFDLEFQQSFHRQSLECHT